MENKIKLRIILINLILTSFILLDVAIPGKESEIKELGSIYIFNAQTGTSIRPTIDEKIIIELATGQRYRIGRKPEKEYSQGNKIIILKSILSNNINEIKILDKKWEEINVGLFSNLILFVFSFFSVLITLLNLFFINNKALNISLIGCWMFITVLFMIYNFSF